ncbi:MAG: leucine-rich repeat protein, partial [Bacteroidales bacterium]|nr:leucine-rich repeat protein [Bacteroidales bacterium]
KSLLKKRCDKCGAENRLSAKFCNQCGRSLDYDAKSESNKAEVAKPKHIPIVYEPIIEQNIIYYEATKRIELLFINVFTRSHKFANGKGEVKLIEATPRIWENAFANSEALTSMVIPDCVKKIGRFAFDRCINLSKVFLPESLIEIGECAFRDCYNLSEIDMPDTVKIIERNAFERCANLRSVRLSNSLKKICDYTFKDCINLTEIVLPDSVNEIESFAFEGCNIHSVVISKSMEKN